MPMTTPDTPLLSPNCLSVVNGPVRVKVEDAYERPALLAAPDVVRADAVVAI